MDNFEADLITICDEDGNEFDFEILDILEFENNNYFILLPVEEEEDEDENGAYYILREEIDENGESDLIAVEDDELLYKIDAVFQERLNERLAEEGAEEEK